MDLGNALKRAGRDDITIRSVIANTIWEVYKRKIEIQSVRMSGKTILVKTWNALINSELQMIWTEVESTARKKLSKMWIIISWDTKIKFLT